MSEKKDDTDTKEEKLELDNYELEQCRCCERQFVIDPKFPRKICIVCWKKDKK